MNQSFETDVRPDTKDRILDVAEQLFSDQGFAPTSLRQITAEAGVNLAAVNYHFHSKLDLLRAVVVRRIGPVNVRRLEILAELQRAAGDAPPPVEQLVWAFIRPIIEAHARSEKPPCIGRLFSRIFYEPGGVARETVIPALGEALEEFLPVLMRSLNCPDRALVLRGFQFGMGGFMLAHLRPDRELPFEHGSGRQDDQQVMDQLVTYMAGGLRALVEGSRHA